MGEEYEHKNFWVNDKNENGICPGNYGAIKHYTISAINTPMKDIDSVLILGDAVTEHGESIMVGNILYVKP